MSELLNVKEKQVIILGIGTNAKMLREIYKQKGIEIVAYVVSDDQNLISSEYEGVPVCKMSECSEKMKNYLVVSSVRECFSAKVADELQGYRFKNVISVKEYKEWADILEYFYQSYFKSKNIDINAPVLNINGSQFVNGFKLDTEGRLAYFSEIGDIILPSYFNDYSICSEGPYELDDIGFRVEKGDVVFDCGANMGLFSVLAINRGGKVYGFEPTPKTREYLKQYERMYPNNMNIVPYALSDEVGDTKFYINSHLNGENSISNLYGTCSECITVKMQTMDNFIKCNGIEKVDFIKADIEGSERYMLLGARETLKKFAPKLSICTYHLKDDPEVLENVIIQANPNYKIIHRYKKLYAYIEK